MFGVGHRKSLRRKGRTFAILEKNACGFRNRDHLRTAIFFHCGGLDLYPGPGANDA
jgi:hypothetical protein